MPSKLNQYATPGQKLLGLFARLLFSGQVFYLSQLAAELKCSKQTIIRMIEQIDKTSQTIESGMEGNRRWYRLKKPPTRPHVSLSAKDIQLLVLCRYMVSHLLPDEFREQLDRTISRTTELLTTPDDRPLALSPVCAASFKGSIDYSPFQEILDTLLSAIQTKKVCEVVYRSAQGGQPKKHSFAPLKIVSYHEAFYVEGIKVQEKGAADAIGDMTLSVHRFVSIEKTRRSHSFTVNDLDCKTGFGLMNGEPFKVKVWFGKNLSTYVRERTWSDDQIVIDVDGGDLKLEFTAKSSDEVISWVLSFGDQAELLEPLQIRDELRKISRSMATKYEKHQDCE